MNWDEPDEARTSDRPGRGETTRGEMARRRILNAASEVIRSRGLAHTTTREIAKTAGYSEAALYKYFRDKEELVLAVMRIRLRPFIELVVQLPSEAGTGTVRARLEDLAREVLAAYEDSGWLAMALLAEPALLERQRAAFAAAGGGPHKANELLAEYLRREQELGRVASTANPAASANLLLGACFQRAFLVSFMSREALGHNEEHFVEEIVTAVLRSLR